MHRGHGTVRRPGPLPPGSLEAGSVNFLETGIIHSSWLSTVSETYAAEIQTAEHGMGLEGLLSQRNDHLIGIVNGVDYGEWSPDVDPHIPASFGPENLEGKRVCRDKLLEEMNLAPNPTGPVIGIVSRMTGQKGFELLPDILPIFLQKEDVRLVVLGSGDESYERYFQWLRDSLPEKWACTSATRTRSPTVSRPARTVPDAVALQSPAG